MRNVGLDIARSLAIVMVLISHSRMFFSSFGDFQWLSFNGFFGVEIFFVLSGFLIGRIIIKEIVEKPSINNLLTFYKRRWYRTLPLYFLMVIILFLIGKPFSWTNLFFLQNFNLEHLNFFPVSWSLSIEEWFYLTIPLLYLIIFSFIKLKNRGNFFIITTVLLLVFINLYRVYEVINNNPTWDFGVRKQIFLRMDSILTGVLIAGIYFYYRKFYDSLKPVYLYCISILGLLFCGYYYVFILDAGKEIINSSIFGRTFLFSFVSLFFALLIVALEKTNFKNLRLKFFTFLSVTSYAVYLIHFELFIYVINNIESPSVKFSWLLLIFSLLATYIFSFLLYKYFEKPILSYRDRNTKTLKSKSKSEHKAFSEY